MGFDATETRNSVNSAAGAVCDALRHLGDISYAIFPRDVAHSLGEFKKSFLNVVRTVVDKEIEWIDERVAGGDRLREEWKRNCASERTEGTGGPVN
ncbi:MAG TPA: hypothetical protein VIV66_01955 [Pyrinomonadaceae bacterium]